jgi:hypothetical protein
MLEKDLVFRGNRFMMWQLKEFFETILPTCLAFLFPVTMKPLGKVYKVMELSFEISLFFHFLDLPKRDDILVILGDIPA